MASIFDDVFVGGAVTASANPQVPLVGFGFRLLSVEPVRPWEDVKDADGRVTRKPNKEKMVTDETGTHIKLALGLQLIDANGNATSPKAPYREATHFFDLDDTKALVARAQAGGSVVLVNPRIEFVDSTKDGWITSSPRLVFDGVTV